MVIAVAAVDDIVTDVSLDAVIAAETIDDPSLLSVILVPPFVEVIIIGETNSLSHDVLLRQRMTLLAVLLMRLRERLKGSQRPAATSIGGWPKVISIPGCKLLFVSCAALA